MEGHIREAHREALTLIVEHPEDFGLVSCFVNGKPAVSVAEIEELEDRTQIRPILVFIEDWMTLTDHDGREPQPIEEV